MTAPLSSYEYALGLTSQFLYCSLPLRLDTYSRCQFGCRYCFARERGGNVGSRSLKALDVDWLTRRLENALTKAPASLMEEFLGRRIPIHFGGMADPFPLHEAHRCVTKQAIQVLADFRYPSVLSTKGVLFARDDYLSTFVRGNFVIQFSVCTADEELHKRINLGAPPVMKLFEAAHTAARAGIPTVCRIQPVFPKRVRDVELLIELAAKAGVRHVAIEHLKLGMEKSYTDSRVLSDALGYDLRAFFQSAGAKRAGREWMLPLELRLQPVLHYRRLTHSRGMRFGAADNDLLFLSDGESCCNGTDVLLPEANCYRFTMTAAIRKGMGSGRITFDSIAQEWHPQRSIRRYVNSKSRTGSDIEDHLRAAWNRSSHGPSLLNFAGVGATGVVDQNGMAVYSFTRPDATKT